MRWVAICLIGLLLSVSAQPWKKLKQLPYRYDEFEKINYYSPYPNGQWYYPTVYPVIVAGTYQHIYRMELWFQYVGDSWIFFDAVSILYDESVYSVQFRRPDRQVLGNGNVSEIAIVSLDYDKQLRVVMRDVVKSKSVKLRFAGKYYYDKTLTPTEIYNLKTYFEIYDSLKPKPQPIPSETSSPIANKPEAKKEGINPFVGIALFAIMVGGIFYVVFQRIDANNRKKEYLARKKREREEE